MEQHKTLCSAQKRKICVFLVDELQVFGYNESIVYTRQGCEEKSRQLDVVQRTPVGVMGYGKGVRRWSRSCAGDR